MKVNNENMYIKTDELGLEDFGCFFESDFMMCLSEYIKSMSNKDDYEISKHCISNELEKDIRLNSFIGFIYHNLGDKVSKDFFDEYSYKFSGLDDDFIESLIKTSLHGFMVRGVKDKFLTELVDYYNFIPKVSKEFNGLASKRDFYEAKELERLEELKKNYVGDPFEFYDFVEDDFEYIDFGANKFLIEDRKCFLRKKLSELCRDMSEYLYFEESIDDTNPVLSVIDEFVEGKSKQLVQLRRQSYKFNVLDYKELISKIKCESKLIPGTVMIVISDIERIAKKNGIILDASDLEMLEEPSFSLDFYTYDSDFHESETEIAKDIVKRYL